MDAVRARLGELDALPQPGHGRTADRWRALAAIGRADLSVARLAEGHVDARAILAELGGSELAPPRTLLGVWAAEPGRLTATPTGGGWRLDGTKAWCSGSTALDSALVTATAPDGPRLFLVASADVHARPGSWRPMGMTATRSDTIELRGVTVDPDRAIGGPDAYVRRSGFGHGGAGVAACWWGGALGVLDGLHCACAAGAGDPAALGRSAAVLAAAGQALAAGAAAIDASPHDEPLAVDLAASLRIAVAHAARVALDATVEALGASGLCQHPEHSGRVADLLVYLGQHRDRPTAERLGAVLAGEPLELAW